MEHSKDSDQPVFHDSGLGSFGSESDSSPVLQNQNIAIGVAESASTGLAPGATSEVGPSKQGTAPFEMSHHKVFRVQYLGESILDRRYTQHMLPWIMAEVRRRPECEKREISMEVLTHTLRASACGDGGSGGGEDGCPAEAVFEHRLQSLSRFARTHQDPKCFAYLTRANVESPFSCHVFQAPEESLVPQLFAAIREATREAVKDYQTGSSIEGKPVDTVGELQTMGAHLFEVMYIGKVKIKEKKAPPTIIDEAVEMFQVETLRKKQLQFVLESERPRLSSETSVRSLPANLERSVKVKENELCTEMMSVSGHRSASTDSSLSANTGSSSEPPNGCSSAENIANGNNVFFDVTPDKDVHYQHLSEESVKGDAEVDSNQNEKLEMSHSNLDSLSVSSGEEDRSTLTTPLPPSGSVLQSPTNRVLLIQVCQYEVCLISPDKKTVIMERKFKDISFCFQGIRQPEHFGFISREPSSSTFVCYVFRCASKPVVEEIMQALQQAFHSAFQESVKNHIVCELCPMHQLHKLCQEIEGLPPSRVYEILLRKVDQLNEKDYNEIMTGFKAEGLATDQEKCEVMMILLRYMCEAKQLEHTHISDTNRATAKYEFNLMDKTKPSKFDNFKSKAKKSLANSFENLMNRGKTRRNEARESFRDRSWTTESTDTSNGRSFDSTYTPGTSPDPSPCNSPVTKEFPYPQLPSPSPTIPDGPQFLFTRPRSSTVGAVPQSPEFNVRNGHSTSPTSKVQDLRSTPPSKARPLESMPPSASQPVSPLRTMFQRANNNSRTFDTMEPPVAMTNRLSPSPSNEFPPSTPQRKMSWRLGILTRVVTPARVHNDRISESPERETGAGGDGSPMPRRKMSSQTIRALWRKAILETLLLIRMEKENISLQARQDAAEIKRVKLDYQEMLPCLKEVTKVWEDVLTSLGRPQQVKVDPQKLHNAVKAGVPRHQRGDIWRLLVEQHKTHRMAQNATPPGEDAVPYEDLLKQLTTQQHAILIDLGRTFPGHPYFARQLGAGQLSLFNLLKAYSLVDKEVGYCQGLSFVAGILLMHMQEECAFDLLKYLMFRLGFRRQYRPDMVALQIQMYQLSRLLHDMYRDLYDHLEAHDIAPTLYAAPWFLTMFASQFPLGFVARVFDLVFLQGVEVVFKVALVLLGDHRELIKQCSSFETIVEFLKTTLPGMSIIQMERVINQVFQLDISKQLHAYEVEYHVLQEEMISSPQRGDADVIVKLETANHSLKRQNMELLEQLQTSHSNQHSLEIQINNLQASHNKFKSDLRALELERAALLQTVVKLRHLVPEEVLAAENIHIPTIFHPNDIHPCTSPGRAPQRSRKTSSESLSDLDHEVANFTSTSSSPVRKPKNKTKHLQARTARDTTRPASSNY